MTAWLKKYKKPPAGFLDLPAGKNLKPRCICIGKADNKIELRNDIYRLAFVTKDTVDFGNPSNCQRSAAFLATCRQVHDEATSILYSENRFVFRRYRG